MISAQADWVMMSLCSAHLEEKHQWGAGVGVEDDLFLTIALRRRDAPRRAARVEAGPPAPTPACPAHKGI